MRIAKTLIRLGGYPGWSECSLAAQVILLVLTYCSLIEKISEAVQSDKTYQEEFNPPPEGSATGVGKQEKVVPVEDPNHDQEQVQHR